MLITASACSDEKLGNAAACRQFSRDTMTSTPVPTSGIGVSLSPERVDSSVKTAGTVASQVADVTANAKFRQKFVAFAEAADARTWSSIEEWQDDDAFRALKSACSPYLR
jgi:hypothetical protein